jgi:hypothetical protein
VARPIPEFAPVTTETKEASIAGECTVTA